MKPSLTQQAHERLTSYLSPGDTAVDATVGNGHDTLFLARQVGPEGQVIGLDIQDAALRVARSRLEQAGVAAQVKLLQEGHERLDQVLPEAMKGQVKAVMFNLGYLPGSDQRIVTRADTTLYALAAALDVLHPQGCISLLVYRGHQGGEEEYQAILQWLDDEDCQWQFAQPAGPAHAPVLIHIRP